MISRAAAQALLLHACRSAEGDRNPAVPRYGADPSPLTEIPLSDLLNPTQLAGNRAGRAAGSGAAGDGVTGGGAAGGGAATSGHLSPSAATAAFTTAPDATPTPTPAPASAPAPAPADTADTAGSGHSGHSPTASAAPREAMQLLRWLSQLSGDAEFEIASAGPEAKAACTGVDLISLLMPLRQWLQDSHATPNFADGRRRREWREEVQALLKGSEYPCQQRDKNLAHATYHYWWALQLDSAIQASPPPPSTPPHASGTPAAASHSNASSRGSGAPGLPTQRTAARAASAPRWRTASSHPPPDAPHASHSVATSTAAHLQRRIGCMLNELGQFHLSHSDLSTAEARFEDAIAAFSAARDHANLALLQLNLAAVSKHRAALHAAAASTAMRTLQTAGIVADSELQPADFGEIAQLQGALDHQRTALAELTLLRSPQPAEFWDLRAHVVAQLANGEAALGSALHHILTDGRSSDGKLVKRAAESLAAAQSLFEELGERKSMQLMMRKQGSLNLAVAMQTDCIENERAANVRLTLALRHYERALSPDLLATGSAPMLVCAAEARLELANFFLSWAGGTKLRNYDSALRHARAALRAVGDGADPQGETCHVVCGSRQARSGSTLGARGAVARGRDGSGRVGGDRDAGGGARRDGAVGGGDAGRGEGEDLPEWLVAALVEAEKRALLQLLRVHSTAGNTAKAALFREEYRAVLLHHQQLSPHPSVS